MTKGFLEEVALQGHAEVLWKGFSLGQGLQSGFAPRANIPWARDHLQCAPVSKQQFGPAAGVPHSSSFLQALTERPGSPSDSQGEDRAPGPTAALPPAGQHLEERSA